MSGIRLKSQFEAGSIFRELKKQCKEKHRRAAAFAKKELKAAAPEDTGDLKRSIKGNVYENSSMVGFTRPKGAHAWWVENGHDLFVRGVKVGRESAENIEARLRRKGRRAERRVTDEGRVVGKPFFAPTWDKIVPELKRILSEPIEL